MIDVEPIFDWLVAGAPGSRTPADVLDRICPDLAAAGVPVERVVAFVRTLHPHIVGRTFHWTLGRRVEVRETSYAALRSLAFSNSPVAEVCLTGKTFRHRFGRDPNAHGFETLVELASAGFTDYVAAPMPFLSGETHAVTFGTRAAGGFTDEHVAAILRIMTPLSRVGEIFALTRTATNLLNTYVGRDAGERILAGRIQRGDIETLRAVIWFSDLRGFTALAGSIAPLGLIRVLNDLFECQIPPIERRGGEVLKFMGDGLLAIFGIEERGPTPAELCDAALAAAAEAFGELATLNAARGARGEPPIQFGLALHVGDIAYGNIGGSGRLDFTCIGPAVNLAARLEGLTGKLGRRLVVSREFASTTSMPVEELGTFDLKGIADAQRVFAPGSPAAA
jgi:adenylate cyclase